MKKPLFLFLVLLFFFSSFSIAVAQFLEDTMKFGMGVRPLGMGGAFVSVADDINAIYYNPAGLGDLVFGYSLGNQDIDGAVYSDSTHNMLNLGSLGLSGWRARTEAGDSLDMTTIAMGTLGPMGLSWGYSYKNIRSVVGADAVSSWSSDIGLLMRVTPDINVGLVGRDAIKSEDLDIPSTTIFGFSYAPFARVLTLALDVEGGRTGDNGLLTQYGAELLLVDGFKIRAGSNRGAGTFGASLRFSAFDLHYASISPAEEGEESIQMMSLELSVPQPGRRPRSLLRPREFALINVGGQLVGGRDEFSLFGGARVGADNIITNIRRAVKDDAIDGILLRISGFDGGFGSIGLVQELRAELIRAKKAGKFVVAYVESSSLGDEYYLASAADMIVAPKGASVGGLGRSIAVTRVTELMDKIGVEWQVFTSGKYKNAFDSLSPEMTKDQREMVNSLVSDMYRQVMNDISAERRIELAKLKEIGDGRIFTASDAKDLGLIDEIGYFGEAAEVAREISGTKDEVRMVKPEEFIYDEGEFFFPWPNKIAVVEVDGEIITGRSGANILFGGTYVGADSVTEQIRMASDDFMVKAIILRVNSPGGSPVASGQIYEELKRARERGKVVVASIGDVAASGGYFVSAAADKIIADPGSITGSIGVIGAVPVIAELYEKIGIETEVIKEGKHADMFSGLRKLTPEEKKSIQSILDDTYEEFKRVVAEGRNMTTEEVEAVAQGRIYTGSQALEVRLVDRLGGFSKAVDLAKKLSKISGDPKIVYYREDGMWMQGLMEVSEKLGIKEGIFPNFKSKLAEYRLSF